MGNRKVTTLYIGTIIMFVWFRGTICSWFALARTICGIVFVVAYT